MWKKSFYIEKGKIVFFILLFSAHLKAREPIGAGIYYPSSLPILRSTVDKLLDKAEGVPFFGKILGIIVPHAGYIYSGEVQAPAYKLLIEQRPSLFIIIAPSHRLYFEGISVYTGTHYKTPLGKIEVDKKLALSLINTHPLIRYVPEAHKLEHSIEVQLPFIQRIKEGARMISIIMGDQSEKYCNILTEALIPIVKKNKDCILIATTDLSHYKPHIRARSIDERTIKTIEEGDALKLLKEVERGEIEMCGSGPVAVLLQIAKKMGAESPLLLSYKTSFDATKKMEHEVVGYASFFIHKKEVLSEKAKKALLNMARSAIKAAIEGEEIVFPKEVDEELLCERGVFVTLKKKDTLRGCIGFIKPPAPLYKAVAFSAIKAATEDIRFPPLTAEELKDVKIQISVLSNLSRIHDPSIIKPGLHGLYIVAGPNTGVLLPQVATEYSLSREAFLSLCCRKAGLAEDAWKNRKDIEIYIFIAEVFQE